MPRDRMPGRRTSPCPNSWTRIETNAQTTKIRASGMFSACIRKPSMNADHPEEGMDPDRDAQGLEPEVIAGSRARQTSVTSLGVTPPGRTVFFGFPHCRVVCCFRKRPERTGVSYSAVRSRRSRACACFRAIADPVGSGRDGVLISASSRHDELRGGRCSFSWRWSCRHWPMPPRRAWRGRPWTGMESRSRVRTSGWWASRDPTMRRSWSRAARTSGAGSC